MPEKVHPIVIAWLVGLSSLVLIGGIMIFTTISQIQDSIEGRKLTDRSCIVIDDVKYCRVQ